MLNFFVALLAAASLAQAQTAIENKDYPEAIRLYQEILSSEGESHAALYGLARAQAFAGQYQAALATYTRLLEIAPNDPDALVGRGRVYSWLKQFEAAETDLKQALAQTPDYQDAWQALADLYRWNQRHSEAEALFTSWQAKSPDQPEPLLAKAQWQQERRQFDKARESLIVAREKGADEALVAKKLAQLNRVPGALPWEAQLSYEFQAFTEQHVPWHTVTGGVQYTGDWGTLALQGLGTQRFDKADQGVVLDSFIDLWPGGYGNFRLQGVWGAEVLPTLDGLAEIYQSVFDTWELSAAYRIMNYPSSNVHFFQGGLGTYLGAWYLRLQPMLFLAEEGPGANVALWARYYYDTSDDYIELRTGLGRRIAVIGADTEGATLQGQTNVFGLLTAQRFFTPNIGVIGTLNYNYDEQFADRFGFSLGTRYRW